MWHPIETAPRDGTDILIFTTVHGITQARFARGEWSHTIDGDEYDGPVWVCGDDAWTIEVEESEDGFYDAEATHWMPLLASPSDDQITKEQAE